MKSKPIFSLIVATIGREQELDIFLSSLLIQKLNATLFEVIIVDQNDVLNLDVLIYKYTDKLDITHIKSKTKGLSYSRNIGISLASGRYVAFPDDDCCYYPDTLSVAYEVFSMNPTIHSIIGRIYDRETCTDVIKRWPKKSFYVNLFNYYAVSSSITIFSKIGFFFDTSFGAGAKYGSCEDCDYIYNIIYRNEIILYEPKVELFHPHQLFSNIDQLKIISYGEGFGAYVGKWRSFPNIVLFFKVLAFHMLHAIGGLFRLNLNVVKMRFYAMKSRIVGFATYIFIEKSQ